MDVLEVLARVSEDIEEAQAQVRAAEGRLKELETVRAGLQLAMQKYGLATPIDITPSRDDDKRPVEDHVTERTAWTDMSRMDAAEQVLIILGRPAKSGEVHERLLGFGRSDTYEQIRSSLGYLKRVGKIARVGRGLWEVSAAAGPKDAEDPAATATGSSVTDRSSEGRSWKEGGPDNGSGTLRGHDQAAPWASLGRGHDLRAPIGGA